MFKFKNVIGAKYGEYKAYTYEVERKRKTKVLVDIFKNNPVFFNGKEIQHFEYVKTIKFKKPLTADELADCLIRFVEKRNG